MHLVWEASTFPQHLKDVLGSEGGRPGKVSDSEMPALTGFGYFPIPPPLPPENAPDYASQGAEGACFVHLYISIPSKEPNHQLKGQYIFIEYMNE